MDQRSGDGRFSAGENFQNFEKLDARIASALNKIIQNSRSQKEDRFLQGRQIGFMVYDYFRVIGAHETVLDEVDLFSITLRNDNVQDFDTRWDEIQLIYDKDSVG